MHQDSALAGLDRAALKNLLREVVAEALNGNDQARLDSEPPAPKKRKGRKLPKWLRSDEITALLKCCRDQIAKAQLPTYRHGLKNKVRAPSKLRSAQRDEVVVHLGLFFGLRAAEMIALNVEHIDLARGTLFVNQGKGKRDRYLPIPSRVTDLLRRWIDGRTEGPFLLNERGKRLAQDVLGYRFERLGRLAGLQRKLTPHQTRHAFATRLLETRSNIREVQELLGHASIQTTAVYLHCDPSRLKSAVDRL